MGIMENKILTYQQWKLRKKIKAKAKEITLAIVTIAIILGTWFALILAWFTSEPQGYWAESKTETEYGQHYTWVEATSETESEE